VSLNASVLGLLAALALGGAAMLLGLDTCRLANALLPGLQAASAWTLPAFCLATAAGAAFGARRSGAGEAACVARWLSAAAAAALAAPALLAAWATPAPPLSVVGRALAAALPSMPVAFCMGVALPLLVALRARGTGAACGAPVAVSRWLALGAAVAAWRWIPLLGAGLQPAYFAAAALAAAAVLCQILAGLASTGADLTEAPVDRPFEPASATPAGPVSRSMSATRRRLPTAALAVTGLTCGLVVPALLRVAGAHGGEGLSMHAHIALWLALGSLVGTASVAGRWSHVALLWILVAWTANAPRGFDGEDPGQWLTGWPLAIVSVAALAALRTAAMFGLPLRATGGTQGTAWGRACALLIGSAGLGAAATGLWALDAPGIGALATLHVTGLLAAAILVLIEIAIDGFTWRVVLPAGCLMALLLVGPERPAFPWTTTDSDAQLLRQIEDARGVLSVVGVAGGRAELQQGGELYAPEGSQPLLARRMGRISASFAPAAQQAVVLGLGSGFLMANLAAVTPATVQCIEPSAARLQLLGELPYEASQSVRGGAPVLEHADPRAWLLAHPRICDLIVGQPPVPDRPGEITTGSAEHFLAMRAALREGGVAVQWFSLERLPWPAFASAARAFLEAFPDARLFVASLRADVPLVALVGGLSRGLPRREAVDALLAYVPSAAGPPASADVLDLYVCDAWTLQGRVRDEPIDTLTDPWVALRSEQRVADHAWIARTNLRLLAELAQPLDTTSFEARPINDVKNRQLGVELTARSAALASLLLARASWLELRDAGPGALADSERASLEDELSATLLAAWKAAPGHLDVRDALLEWANELVRQDRWELAGALLQSAVDIAPDGRQLGLLGGVLLHLDHAAPALELLMYARQLAPGDRTVLVNLGTAQLFLEQDAAARETLAAAREACAPALLPPLLDVTLRILDGEQAAVAPARELLAQIPVGNPWRVALQRVLRQPPAGGVPPAEH